MAIALERGVDPDRLRDFVFRAVGEVGATLNTALVVLGDQLGLYRALAGAGPLTPTELADRTGTAVRYVHEWLCAQAAGGFVDYDPDTARFTLPPEQAVALTDEASPDFLPGLFQFAFGSVIDSPRITQASKTGAGVGWEEHVSDVQEGCERFFRPAYRANLTTSWLPALDGVVCKLEAGALVADVGCGRGASTALMAQAYPNSRFFGSDQHSESIDVARKRAGAEGLTERLRFDVSPASAFGGGPYDLVTTFDCLHEMGDSLRAARHIHASLKPSGTWLIVEPAAADRLEDNINPIGRAYYCLSMLVCTPLSLAQGAGVALGAQAGEARLRKLVTAAGFSSFRRVAETPFNAVYEARP